MVFFQLNVTGLLFQSFRTASPNGEKVIAANATANCTTGFTINLFCLIIF